MDSQELLSTESEPMNRLPHSLRRYLFSLLGWSLAMVFLLSTVGVVNFIAQTERAAWQGRQHEAALRAAETVGAFLQRVRDAMSLVGSLAPDHLQANQVMENQLARNQALLEIIRTSESGEIISSAATDEAVLTNLFTISQSNWFLHASSGDVYLGEVQLSSQGAPYMIIAIPALDGGVVAARLRMSVLWDVVSQIHFGQTGSAYVIDQDSQIIGHADPNIPLSNVNLAGRSEKDFLLDPSEQQSKAYVNFQGSRVIGTANRIPGTDWIVVTELPRTEAYANTRSAMLILGGGLLLIMIVVMIWASRFMRLRIIYPMETLHVSADRIRLGDLTHRIKIERLDEIGQVAQSFNKMTSRLQAREEELADRQIALTEEIAERKQAVEELQQIRTHLEERVAKRTATLSILLETARTVSSTLQLDEVLQLIAQKMVHAIGVSGCTISRLDMKANVIVTWIEWRQDNAPPEPVGSTYSLDDFPASRAVIEHRLPHQILVTDPEADPFETAHMVAVESTSLLMLPLIAGETTIGLVELDESEIERRFSDEEIALCQALADQAAIAIENAWLYQQAQEDIAERRRAQTEILAALKEKETLLKEVHHRVKNNLQVISSILNLQSENIQDPLSREIFREAQNRVRSMSLIHEKIYQSKNLARIDFGKYIQSLAAYLFRSYSSNAVGISLETSVEALYLDVDTAVPCGLILNELISNALKHAFPDGRTGKISIKLQSDGTRFNILTVSDNGIGLPRDMDFTNSPSLGMQLVHSLVGQLDGTIETNLQEGTEFRITFGAQLESDEIS